MKVIFLGRKPAASVALRYLVDAGVDVAAVVAPPADSEDAAFSRPLLSDTARDFGLPVVSDEILYDLIAHRQRADASTLDLTGVDLVLSFLFWKKIRRPLIDLGRLGCFNFHPAPLPEFRGARGYNFAILEGHAEYGASVHWVDEAFDRGDLVEVRRFAIAPDETAFSLERKTMDVLIEMFRTFVVHALSGRSIARTPQGNGRSATKQEMLEAAAIRAGDDAGTVARRVRAFWYPPYSGATIEVGGRRYTLVDDETLRKLGAFLHGGRSFPY